MMMTCNSKELLPIWEELQKIFLGNKKFSKKKLCSQLNKLGFETEYGNKHIKMYVVRNGKRNCIVISSTGSDKNAGWMILQSIRRIYEREE